MKKLTLCFLALSFCHQAIAAEPKFLPTDAKRVLFLGDSITYAGHYVASVDARLRVEHPNRNIEVLNLGLPSETCSGLSEPDHPYPRPNVHERLSRALAKFKPDVVVACYGMNDGIYYPFSEDRFAKYKKGIGAIIKKVKATGAKLVLMTPPAFDPLPLKQQGKLRPAGSEKFAWFAIYEGYDDVLTKYSAWIMQQGKRVDLLIDLHTPVIEYVAQKRKTNPKFTMSPDGVHVNREGHAVISKAILKAWGYGGPSPVKEKFAQLVEQREVLLRDGWLTYVGHKRPNTKVGLSLENAKPKIAELERQISGLLK